MPSFVLYLVSNLFLTLESKNLKFLWRVAVEGSSSQNLSLLGQVLLAGWTPGLDTCFFQQTLVPLTPDQFSSLDPSSDVVSSRVRVPVLFMTLKLGASPQLLCEQLGR